MAITIGQLNPGQDYSATRWVWANNDDRYEFSLSRSATVDIQTAFDHDDADVDIRLYDQQDNIVTSSMSTTDNESIREDLDAGEYELRVWSFNNGTAQYELDLEVTTSDDYASSTDTSGRISVNGDSTGNIENGSDTDWFQVSLDEGEEYQIDLEGSRTNSGSLRDPYFRGVYDEDGDLISGTTNDDGGEGLNSSQTFTPDADGTYYLSAGSFSSSTGTYTLALETQDDYSSDTDTDGRISVNGNSTGNIETGSDTDWFQVSLDEGEEYQIDLEGSRTNSGSLRDPYFRGVYDEDGDLISGTTNDDGGEGLNSSQTFTPDSDGTYYLSAGSFSSSTGTYTLSLEGDEIDDYPSSPITSGQIDVNGTASGNIEVGSDQDWFQTSLDEGVEYQIDLEGSRTNSGSLRDPYFRGVYDEDGDLISGTTNDDGGEGLNSSQTFTPDSDGTYYLSAGSFSSNTGTYTLSLEGDEGDGDEGGSSPVSDELQVGVNESVALSSFDMFSDVNWAQVWQSNQSESSATVSVNGQEVGQNQWFHVGNAQLEGGQETMEESMWFQTWSSGQGSSGWFNESVDTVNDEPDYDVAVNGSTSLRDFFDDDVSWVQVWQSNQSESSATVTASGQEVGQSQWFHIGNAQLQGAEQAMEESMWVQTWSSEDGTSGWFNETVVTGGSGGSLFPFGVVDNPDAMLMDIA